MSEKIGKVAAGILAAPFLAGVTFIFYFSFRLMCGLLWEMALPIWTDHPWYQLRSDPGPWDAGLLPSSILIGAAILSVVADAMIAARSKGES